MKDIGEKIKNTRISTGISVEEAAEDLNYKVSQLEDIENGNYKNFKDKFVLKAIVSDYSKYLGLDVEEIIDQFNDFVFESTSKIPLAEIEKASKMKEKNEDVKIASPYTATEEKNKIPKVVYIVLIVLLLVAVGIFVYYQFFKPKVNTSFDVSYEVGDLYEERI